MRWKDGSGNVEEERYCLGGENTEFLTRRSIVRVSGQLSTKCRQHSKYRQIFDVPDLPCVLDC